MKLVRMIKLPQKKLFEVLRKSFIKEKNEKNAVTMRMKNLYLDDEKKRKETKYRKIKGKKKSDIKVEGSREMKR